jgi:hypothetical protein
LKKIKRTLLVTVIAIILIIPTVYAITQQENNSETVTFSADSDNDGYSDEFEKTIAGTDALIPNDCYFLSFNTIENTIYREDKTFTDFLTKNKVPSENIINLFSVDATKDNLINSLTQLSEKADENDILIIYIYSHGDSNVFQPFKTGLTFEQISTGNQDGINDIGSMEVWDTMSYSELNHCFDKIQSKILIIFNTCGNQDFDCFETLKGNNRTLIAAYNKYGQLDQIMQLIDDEYVQTFNNALSHCVFTEQPDQETMEIPLYKWLLENYDSINAIWNDIDQNGDNYVSLYEDISWIQKTETATVFEDPEKSYAFHGAFKVDNLEILQNIYFPNPSPITP